MLTAAPIDPTAEEEGILRTYFEYSNRLFPCVPEGDFYRALTSSAYDTADAVALAATTSMADSATISDFMEQNKTAMGFRALFYTVLGAGARLQARPKLAEDYFQVGQTYLSLCFCLPSQPSAAAMTLMATAMRVSGRMDMASCYSALAQRMCETLNVDEHQRLCTLLVYYMCCGRVISMPTREVPAGVPLSVRFADIMGYMFGQLSHNFPDMDSDGKLAELAALVAQADDLQMRYGFLSHIRVADIFRALRSLILMHLGRPGEAIPLAREALQVLQRDKLAPFNLPLMLTLRKIRDMLRAAGVDAGADTDGLISISDRVFQGMPGATSLEDFQRRAADFSRSRMSTSGLPMAIAPLTAVAASALASMARAPPPPAADAAVAGLAARGYGGLPVAVSGGTDVQHMQYMQQRQQQGSAGGYGSSAGVPPPPISAAAHMPPVGGVKRQRAPSLGGETTPGGGGIPIMAAGAGTPGGSLWTGGQGAAGGGDSGSVGSNDFFDALINPSLMSVEGAANVSLPGGGASGGVAATVSAPQGFAPSSSSMAAAGQLLQHSGMSGAPPHAGQSHTAGYATGAPAAYPPNFHPHAGFAGHPQSQAFQQQQGGANYPGGVQYASAASGAYGTSAGQSRGLPAGYPAAGGLLRPSYGEQP